MPFVTICRTGADLPVSKLETASFARADIIAAIARFEGDQPLKPYKGWRGYVVHEYGGAYLGIMSTLERDGDDATGPQELYIECVLPEGAAFGFRTVFQNIPASQRDQIRREIAAHGFRYDSDLDAFVRADVSAAEGIEFLYCLGDYGMKITLGGLLPEWAETMPPRPKSRGGKGDVPY
ncbi:hypothetical protein G8E10_24915 [Rhizobiaceae bacterium CRRU44]|uniref:Uncharacterized protein n=1 Tax=Ferranicluibacter rubi TaxID=2715133 RepID=A0AA43ZKZ3_9HYPH|nr:hypothetical protein [Ferranicluibacter rubi]NHT78945.1 hypothetical protein [Ferranicluibacter rubi]